MKLDIVFTSVYVISVFGIMPGFYRLPAGRPDHPIIESPSVISALQLTGQSI
jgi:hypothetical protein